MVIVTSPKDIAAYRKLTLRSALGLEIKGLKRRGKSVYSIIKKEFNLKGNMQSVYNQFETMLKAEGVLV